MFGLDYINVVYKIQRDNIDERFKIRDGKAYDKYEAFKNEASLLNSFTHPGIVSLYGVTKDNNGINGIIMELMTQGSLGNIIKIIGNSKKNDVLCCKSVMAILSMAAQVSLPI